MKIKAWLWLKLGNILYWLNGSLYGNFNSKMFDRACYAWGRYQYYNERDMGLL
jgi:hypothetical protein